MAKMTVPTPDRPSIEAELQDVHRAAVLMDGREDTVGAFHDALAALRARFLEQQKELEEIDAENAQIRENCERISNAYFELRRRSDLAPQSRFTSDELDALIQATERCDFAHPLFATAAAKLKTNRQTLAQYRDAAIQPGGTPQK